MIKMKLFGREASHEIDEASGVTCSLRAPNYLRSHSWPVLDQWRKCSLLEDTVTWSMTIATGRSCIRGVRFSNVQLESLKLIAPPQSGEVVLRGSGFVDSANADFSGQDRFSLLVVGLLHEQRGSSTIHVNVFDSSTQRPVPPPYCPRRSESLSGDRQKHTYHFELPR
jgi:hypothetical protein